MAIYHLSVKPIQRSKGQSSVAGAAYRAGDNLKDDYTMNRYDYRCKKGVIYSQIITPKNKVQCELQQIDRSALWNMAEKSEKRKDATPAKEYEISLPVELSEEERKQLTLEFAKYLVERHQCVADVAIHQPSRQGDQRNFHAHILCTTRKFEEGKLTAKCDVELSDRDRKKKGLGGRREELEQARKVWEQLVNKSLKRANILEKVDSRSLVEQGFTRKPTQHMGKNATAIERKGIEPRRTRIKESIDLRVDKNNHIKIISPEQEFGEVLECAGLKLNGPPVMDGRMHLVTVESGKTGSREGVYSSKKNENGVATGWYVNHRINNEKNQWTATGKLLNEEQKTALKATWEPKKEVPQKKVVPALESGVKAQASLEAEQEVPSQSQGFSR